VNICNYYFGSGGENVKAEWTGKLVGKMHTHEITIEDIANECGWVKGYVSMILNGQRNPIGAREKLEAAFDAIVKRQKSN